MQVARCKTHNMATNYNCQMLGVVVVAAFVNVVAAAIDVSVAIVVVVVAVVRAIIRPIGIDEAITPTDH